jgi:hypothetical protein
MYPWHRIRLEPKAKTDYWFSKYNRVLLHYSVSIASAAATAAYIPMSAAAVYIPQSAAAAAAHTPRSAAFRLFSRNTSENADVIENTLGVLYNTSNY